jgi:hypothetical protein
VRRQGQELYFVQCQRLRVQYSRFLIDVTLLKMGASVRPQTPFTATRPFAMVRPGLAASAGFGVLLIYLLALWSRLQDYVPYLHLPAVLLGLLIVAALLSGSFVVFIRTPFGRCLLLLTVWMAISIPFSVWMGGSVQFFYNQWLRSLAVAAITTGLIWDLRQVRMALGVLAIGAIITAATALVTFNTVVGRLGGADTRFNDSNDLAQFVLVGMCLWAVYVGRRPKRQIAVAICAWLAIGTMMVVFLRTGSRGGLLGAAVVIIELFRQSSVAGKMRMAVIVIAVSALAVVVTPKAVMNRYLSMFDSDVDSGEEARGSAEGRQYLLKESLWLTIRHPLFGVGPGMFMVAENDEAKTQGLARGNWHETHNLYTQVSSECGIPALIFYLGAWYYAFRGLKRVRNTARSSVEPWLVDAGQIAFWLRMTLVATAASGFFLSVAYMPELQVLLGLSVAFATAVEREGAARMTSAPNFTARQGTSRESTSGVPPRTRSEPGLATPIKPVIRRPPRPTTRPRW